MGNEIRCCRSCQGEAMTFATHQEAPVDARASPIPSSSPSKPRGPGGPVGPSGLGGARTAFAPASVRGSVAQGSEAERDHLRAQLKAFIADATDTVPVAFVDVSNGSTQVGCYTLDPRLQIITLEAGGERSCLPLQQIVEVFRPEDCLVWERAGHRWPDARLRRLVLVSLLAPEGDSSLRGWLEADESRRDRCVVSLSVLAAPPIEEPTGTSGCCGPTVLPSGNGSPGVAQEAPPRQPVGKDELSASEPGCEANGKSSLDRSGAIARPAAWPREGGNAARPTAMTAHQSGAVASGPLGPAHAATQAVEDDGVQEGSAAEELRRITRQFAHDAAAGVEGILWVDISTGSRTLCRYRLDPVLGELVFAVGPQSTSASAAEPLLPAAKEAAVPSGSTTAASSPRQRGTRGANSGHGSGRVVTYPQEGSALGRVRLARIRKVWRPEQRCGFAEEHMWYLRMPPEERERLLCIDHGPGGPAADDAFRGPLADEGAAAMETVCILERDPVARERFVVCAKVLRLSVS